MPILILLGGMSLLAAAAAPTSVVRHQQQRSVQTLEEMERVLTAMLGSPATGRAGYVSDMGRMPATLSELNVRGRQRRYRIRIAGIGFGWNGPYVRQIGDGNGLGLDSWGTPYTYDPNVVQLTSLGADRTLGTEDDLIRPVVLPPVSSGDLRISVWGRPLAGGQELLDSGCVREPRVYFSNNGRQRSQTATWSGNAFVFRDTHAGSHLIEVRGRNQGGRNKYRGSRADVVKQVVGETNEISVTLVERFNGGRCP